MTVRRTAYAKPLPLAPLRPARPWQSWKRSSDGKVERWPRSTRAPLIAVGWRKARCTSSRERPMNKHYPHLADKLPAPSEKVGNIKILFLRWWAREDSNLQPSGYEPLALTIELRAPKSTRAKGQAVSTILYRIVLPNLAGSIKIPPVRRTDSRTTTAFSAACARPRR